MKVSLAALRRAREMTTLEQCLEQDYRVSTACAADPDLIEGVRAQVVDKDREPRWRPSALSEVTPEAVEGHFAAVEDEPGLERVT
ncbi:MAG: enoyl-CoA hydratase/isomerase family protein [Solirubrobacterales bacterium]